MLAYVLLGLIGLAGGGAIAGAYVVVVSTLGVYTRLAAWAKEGRHLFRIELLLLAGTVLGTIVTNYDVSLPFGSIGLGVLGLFFGIYTGCLAAAIADVVKLFPIFCRRVHLRKGLPYIIALVGAGKAIGTYVQFFMFHKLK